MIRSDIIFDRGSIFVDGVVSMHLIIHAKKMRDINRSAKIFDGFFEVVSCLLSKQLSGTVLHYGY